MVSLSERSFLLEKNAGIGHSPCQRDSAWKDGLLIKPVSVNQEWWMRIPGSSRFLNSIIKTEAKVRPLVQVNSKHQVNEEVINEKIGHIKQECQSESF